MRARARRPMVRSFMFFWADATAEMILDLGWRLCFTFCFTFCFCLGCFILDLTLEAFLPLFETLVELLLSLTLLRLMVASYKFN